MKIKDILGEDDATPMKVKSISGDEVDIDQGGTDIKAKVSDLIANPDKPGEFQMKPPPTSGQGAVQPGSTVTTSEEIGDETKKVFKHHGKPVGEIGIDPEASPGGGNWYVKHYASGHDTVGFDNAEEAMAELKYIVKHHMEENQDLISQGNQDVGGDATDNFIDQVRDKDFERAQGQGGERSGRDERSAGILSPISEDDALLEKMRVIAGLR